VLNKIISSGQQKKKCKRSASLDGKEKKAQRMLGREGRKEKVAPQIDDIGAFESPQSGERNFHW